MSSPRGPMTLNNSRSRWTKNSNGGLIPVPKACSVLIDADTAVRETERAHRIGSEDTSSACGDDVLRRLHKKSCVGLHETKMIMNLFDARRIFGRYDRCLASAIARDDAMEMNNSLV
jgi:hypothetical protein